MDDRFTIAMELIVRYVFFQSAFLFFLEPHKSEGGGSLSLRCRAN